MTNKKYKIVFIGAGNIATHLGLAFLKAKHSIIQVCALHKESSEKLAKLLKSKSTTSIKNIDTTADIYIIAVNDDSISKIAKQLKLENKIILHTSGSIDMKALQKSSENCGVFYPVQTFSKEKQIDFKNIPVCLEANNEATYKTIESLAKSISTNIHNINSKQRKTIHLAAVFANNFSNHLFSVSENILKENNLPFEIVKPLIEETANKIKHNSPTPMQTGPAIRGDIKTMKAHKKLLSGNKDYQNIYKLLSESIIKSSKKNK